MTKTTIFIVEDEAIVAADLGGKLQALGYEVVGTAATGEEAVAMVGALRPNLVVMDISLQGSMDGVAVAETVQVRYDAPVVYLTAHSDPATLERAKLTSPFGYILKPFDERELATQIELALYKYRAEQQLRQQREWLRVTLTSIGDAVIATDGAGLVTFMNPVATSLTGWTSDEAAGQPVERIFEVVDEQTGEALDRPVAQVLRGCRPVTLPRHAALVTRDGRRVPVEDSAAPILDAAGRVIGAVLVFHDATDRRRAEEQLRKHRDELESKVQQRTAELAGMVAALQQEATVRQAAQERVQAERQQFHNVLDMLPAYVALLTSDHHVSFANRFFEERFGSSASRCCYDYLFNRAEPCENCETFVDLQTESPRRWEWVGPDGRTYDIHDFPFLDVDGSQRILEVGLDVTEMKRTQNALKELNETLERRVHEGVSELRESELRYRKLFSTMNEGFALHELVFDAEGKPCDFRYLEVNPGFERSTGLKAEELVGHTLYEVLPETEPIWLERYSRVALTGEPDNFEEYHKQTGRWYDVYASPAGPNQFAVMFLNVTERKRAEDALRASREDLDRAQAVAQCGSWRLDVRDNELRWSDEAWRIFGVPRGTPLTYEVFLDTVHPDDRARVHASWTAALNGAPYEVEHRIVVGDEIKWVRERGELEFDEQGTLLGGFGTTQDITSKKRAEESLAAAKAAAEAANQAKSQFLARMSHELRTPMNAILGMIDIALPKAVNPAVRDCLETARSSADLLLTLLNDLLDSAKIESGKLELEAAPFSLRSMLDHITRVLAVRASEKGLCFCCRLPDDTPDLLVGDRMRLQQVLLNLAGNAIKFTERGEVEITVRAAVAGADACVEFAVRDTGIGIAAASLPDLFEPFVQVDASTARRYGGTGLGLSICKSLVELMGGRIWVHSTVGEGSTFHFTARLPVSTERPADVTAPPPLTAQAHSPLHILLAEDNTANQKLVAYILKDRGHTIEVANNGHEAVRLAQTQHYDVILMDVQMPDMDGLAATAAIRQLGGAHVPIIAMTAHAMRGDRERCLAAGMDGYLSKPVNAHEMIAVVEHLGEQRMLGEAHDPTAKHARHPTSATRLFDRDLALMRCSNRPDIIREMARCFREDVENLFPRMRSALAQGNLAEIGRICHRMKTTLIYLGAQPALDAAERAEQCALGGNGPPPDIEAIITAFEQECLALKSALSQS